MKVKYFSILLLLAVFILGCNKTNYVKLAQNKFNIAKKYNNPQSAIEAVHEILIHSPESLLYKDTLLNLYSNTNLKSASILALELEKEGNRSLKVLNVLAYTYKTRGYFQKALDYYTEINEKDNSVVSLYEKALLEFELSKNAECMKTSMKIVNDENSLRYKVKVEIQNKVEKPILASAVYNMMGMISLNVNNDKELAMQYLSNAYGIDTTFQTAKNNYSTLSYKQNLRKAMGVE